MKTEFIESVVQLLRSKTPEPETQPITAAKVGSILRREHGGAIWQDFGFVTLKQLLVEMESKGFLRIGRTTKDALAIQLGDSGKFNLAPPQPDNKSVASAHRFLRKVYWIAFALEHPTGKRFVNSSSGEIRFGLEEAPEPSKDWIECESVAPETQKSWAEQFLAEKNIPLDHALSESLAADDWYQKFPKVLNGHAGHVLPQWNRIRSRKISTEVENWCKKHGIAIDTAFQPQIKRPKLAKEIAVRKATIGPGAEEAWVRKVVLDALSHAPIETLLELSVPMKFVLNAISENKPRR